MPRTLLRSQRLHGAGFREVAGTVAGADSVLVLTENERAQKRFFSRLTQFLRAGKR